LHLVGLVSPGGVHSLDEHLYALLGLAEEKGLRSVYIHMFTDGRDTEPKVALDSLKKLRDKMAQTNVGKIATLTGRFYAMDRGGHWTQTKMTYEAMVEGKGEKAASAEECIKNNYQSQIFDEMIKPTVLAHEDGTPTAVVSDNDAVIFFNFRSDRALQLTQMFVDQSKVPQEFHCRMLQNLFFVSMTEYVSGLPVTIAYPSMDLSNNLAEVVSKAGMLQFHIAESEKYAHVTAFFNGGRSEKFPGEERVIVTSPENNSRNYVDHPEMSAKELTRVLTQKIEFGDANLFVANFANPDMVGHTGSLTAAIEAVECVDACLKEIYQAVMKVGGALVVTADHGNAEQMINKKSGGIDTDHTTNPVPFLIVGEEFQFEKPLDIDLLSLSAHVPAGVISDVAPTVLDLFGMKKPKEMTAVSLFEEIDEVPLKE
jgi:2,3-bisphosphoglycerate-independent phosphoglycerate mutase